MFQFQYSHLKMSTSTNNSHSLIPINSFLLFLHISRNTTIQFWNFSFTHRYFYPRQLLSQQFWHPDQKSEFVLEEYEKRSQYYLPLIKECGWTAKEIHNEELLKFCLKVCA